MESLQDWGLLGEIYIGYGFIRGKLTGIYYDILERVGGRLAAGVALCKALGARLPGGDSLWSPNGVAEIMQDTKPVRLPGGGLLFYEEK